MTTETEPTLCRHKTTGQLALWYPDEEKLVREDDVDIHPTQFERAYERVDMEDEIVRLCDELVEIGLMFDDLPPESEIPDELMDEFNEVKAKYRSAKNKLKILKEVHDLEDIEL